jgi:hypothetical protein
MIFRWDNSNRIEIEGKVTFLLSAQSTNGQSVLVAFYCAGANHFFDGVRITGLQIHATNGVRESKTTLNPSLRPSSTVSLTQ